MSLLSDRVPIGITLGKYSLHAVGISQVCKDISFLSMLVKNCTPKDYCIKPLPQMKG